jgi:hypothetical protein
VSLAETDGVGVSLELAEVLGVGVCDAFGDLVERGFGLCEGEAGGDGESDADTEADTEGDPDGVADGVAPLAVSEAHASAPGGGNREAEPLAVRLGLVEDPDAEGDGPPEGVGLPLVCGTLSAAASA